MSTQLTVEWLDEHYTHGWYLSDNGDVVTDASVEAQSPIDPVQYVDGKPAYAPPRQRLIEHGIPTFICRACGEPSWAVTRHAAERHGVDVAVVGPLPGKVRPEWMHPDWI